MKHLSKLWILVIMFAMLCFLWNHQAMQSGAWEGLRLCGEVLIPALFPFSVLCSLTIRLGLTNLLRKPIESVSRPILGLPGRIVTPFVFGMIGGYPIGAQMVSKLYCSRKISREDAISASVICNQPGPSFLLGAVGAGVFGSAAAGLLLILLNALSALLTAVILIRRKGCRKIPYRSSEPNEAFFAAFPAAVWDGVQSMLRVCGIVIFCAALMQVLSSAVYSLHLPSLAFSFLYGFLELSGGLHNLVGCNTRVAFCLAAGLVSWGGVCVHFQVIDALTNAGLPIIPYLRGKAVQGLLALLLSSVLFYADNTAFFSFRLLSFLLPTLFFLPLFCLFKKLSDFLLENSWKRDIIGSDRMKGERICCSVKK